MARAIKDSIVCGLARANDKDIRRAGDALKGANAARIHTFIATSPIHMERKLRMTPEQVVEQAVKAVKLARSYTRRRRIFARGRRSLGGRFPVPYSRAVIKAGATTINIPDTVGYTIPDQFGEPDPDLARAAFPTPTRSSGQCIATMTWGWRWPTRCPRS